MSGHTTTADAVSSFNIDRSRLEKLSARLRNPLIFRFYLLAKLPLGFVAGLRVKSLDETRCETTVPYGWRTQNPFKSTYFAAQSMAAELSTGAPAALATDLAPFSVAMLITGMDAQFGKKANRLTTFTCEDCDKIFAAVAETCDTGEPTEVTVTTVGRMPDGTEVSRFTFTWSFKKRSRQ